MLRKYINLPIIFTLLIAATLIIWIISFSRPESPGQESAQSGGSSLTVDSEGSQMTTDVSGADLQPASPPNRSATSPELSPQQAKPNYCSGSEIPFQDGCIPNQ